MQLRAMSKHKFVIIFWTNTVWDTTVSGFRRKLYRVVHSIVVLSTTENRSNVRDIRTLPTFARKP